MFKKRKCLRVGCKNTIPYPRKKYCSTECNIQHYYIDLRLKPRILKLCSYTQCSKKFSGTKNQKYCSITCRIKSQYNKITAAQNLISSLPHLCICCEPPKQITGKGKYCPDNEWMKHLSVADKKLAEENAATLTDKNSRPK